MRIDVKFTEAAKRRIHPKSDFVASGAKGVKYNNSFITITYADGFEEIIRIASIESMEITP